MTEQQTTPPPARQFLMDALNGNGPGQAFVRVHQCVPSCREAGCQSVYDTIANVLLLDHNFICGGPKVIEEAEEALSRALAGAGRLLIFTELPPSQDTTHVVTTYRLRGGEVARKVTTRLSQAEPLTQQG